MPNAVRVNVFILFQHIYNRRLKCKKGVMNYRTPLGGVNAVRVNINTKIDVRVKHI